MVRFIEVVQRVDMVTDCIPVLSAIKNVAILVYQAAHEVLMEPPAAKHGTTWKEDLKIHFLSKEQKLALLASIPLIGAFAAIKYEVFRRPVLLHFHPTDRYLCQDVSYGMRKHFLEIFSLISNSNQNVVVLGQAMRKGFDLENLLKYKWTQNQLASALCEARTSAEYQCIRKEIDMQNLSASAVARVILYLENQDWFVSEHLDELLQKGGPLLVELCRGYPLLNRSILESFLEKKPETDDDALGQAVIALSKQFDAVEHLKLLFEKFPEKHLHKAVLQHDKTTERCRSVNQEVLTYIKNTYPDSAAAE